MRDYTKSKIYKLECDDGFFYVGSTTGPLGVRMSGHKRRATLFPERKLYKHIAGRWDSVRLTLVEALSCANREELAKREDTLIQQHLRNPLCLNTNRAILSAEELADYNRLVQRNFRRNHPEKKSEQNKRYYAAHKEEISQKAKLKRQTVSESSVSLPPVSVPTTEHTTTTPQETAGQ